MANLSIGIPIQCHLPTFLYIKEYIVYIYIFIYLESVCEFWGVGGTGVFFVKVLPPVAS
jgi:hypothetical protein